MRHRVGKSKYSGGGTPKPPKNMLTANERLASKLIHIASRSEADTSQALILFRGWDQEPY